MITRKTAQRLDFVALAIILVIAGALAATWPPGQSSAPETDLPTLIDATVSSIAPCGDPALSGCTVLDVVPSTGVDAGQVFRIPEVQDVTFSVGDKIVLRTARPADGGFRYAYEDHQRLPLLAGVGAVVALGLVLAGWRHGLQAMVALGGVAALLYFYTLPALSHDPDSLTVGIITAICAATVASFVTGGITPRRTIATIGSIVALVSVASLTWLVLRLAGVPTALVLTGATLGSAGAVIALATSQTEATFDWRAANPTSSLAHTIRSSIRANQSRVSSTLVTLVFANLGAGVTVLIALAAVNQPALQTLNSVQVATLVLVVLVGIGGMLLAIPATAALAASLTAETAAAEEVIVLTDRPPVKRQEPTLAAPRRRRDAMAARPKVTVGDSSLWERMRQGLDD